MSNTNEFSSEAFGLGSWSPFENGGVEEEPVSLSDSTSFEIDYQTSSRGLFDEGESLADELDWVSNQSATVVVSKGEDPSSFASIPLDDADDVSVEFVAPKSESVHSDTNESQEIEDKNREFEVSVTNPKVQGEGVSSFVTYNVYAKTTLNFYQKKEMSVDRRFSDFLWLHDQLVEHHKGIIIPPVPDKDLMKTNKISGNRFSSQFLEYRTRELERFLNRVSQHHILRTSKALQLFLETSDTSKFVTVKADEKQKSGGFFSRITKALGSTSGAEIDPWFTQKTVYISQLKTNLESLSVASQNVNQYHANAISVHTPFMNSMKSMGACESKNSPELSNSCIRISEIIAQLEMFEHELNQNAGRGFVDVINDYVRLTDSVQRVLDWRLLKLGDYQQAERDLQKLTTKNDSQTTTAQQKLEETKEIFESASSLVRSEIENFEKTKAKEIQFAIVEFVQFNMNREICMRDLWKKFMIDMQ